MSQGFRFKYNQMQEGNPATPDQSGGSGENYAQASHARNVAFVLPDGGEVFLNYAYLVCGKYFAEDNQIVLVFTSDTVTLSGIHLKSLYDQFKQHLPMQITCFNERYNPVDERDNPIVNGIEIIPTRD